MRTNIANTILPNRSSSFDRDLLTDALRLWRKRIGYYSMFAAVPAILTSQAHASRADDPVGSAAPRPSSGSIATGRERFAASCGKPAFLKRQSEYRLPHQKGTYNFVDVLAGNDDCPGRTIPGGNYTAAAPYTDTGNTSAGNNTVNVARGFYYCYYSYNAHGPDHVYSFTLTSRGPNPKIEVTTSSGTYRPMVYVLDGSFSGSCPSGTGNTPCTLLAVDDSRWGSGNTAALTRSIEFIPLNSTLHVFVDSAQNDAAGSGAYTLRMQDITIAPAAAPTRRNFDFDGDGKADPSVYRPKEGRWYVQGSTSGPATVPWGVATDKIVPADYDRDGKTDIAVFRPSEGRWYILNSNNGTLSGLVWGNVNDIPIPGDFDGDQKVDVVVFRPSDGRFYARESLWGSGFWVPVGQNGDIPVPGNYDGDGYSDFAVFRPSTGAWVIRRANGSGTTGYQYGLSTDKAVPADYDGDNKTDIAVYRPSEGRWYIANSGGNPAHTAFQFGLSTDIPVPADYDGDGRADIAIFRPSDGTWWINRTTAGLTVIQWGQSGDKPTPNAFGN